MGTHAQIPLRRVVITGTGAISPFGQGVEALLTGIRAGRSAVVDLSAEWSEKIPALTCRVGAPLPEPLDPKQIERKFRRSMGPTAMMATLAAREAFNQAGLEGETLASGRVGVSFASTTGSTSSLEQSFLHYFQKNFTESLSSSAFFQIMSHTCAANLAHFFGIRGRVVSPDSACASAAQAIGLGFEAIRYGLQDAMLCGGADELHAVVTGCFDLVHASSCRYNDHPDRTPRPFDAGRDGTVCGEGAGALVLESEDSARARGARILAEVAGFDTVADGGHLAQPLSDSITRCLHNALDNAGVLPEGIGYVNAHGTGTALGDAAEAQAVMDVFGPRRVAMSSLKGHIGHTLGASAALETIVSLDMLANGYLAPTRNLTEVAADCAGPDHVTAVRQQRFDAFVKNCFAFGGINTVLVVKRYEDV